MKKEGPVKVRFPLIFLRTSRGIKLLDRLGSLKFTKLFGWILLSTLPILGGLFLYLILQSISIYITNPQVREAAKAVSPLSNLLIPGLNPYLPILYGWIAIAVGIAVHEVGHGMLAKAVGVQVKSIGLLLFTVIPIGAFVEIDEKELMNLRLRDSSRIWAAGPGNNLCVALIALVCLLLIIGSMSPVSNGLGVLEVNRNFPAEVAGLKPGDVILRFDEHLVMRPLDLDQILVAYEPGAHLTITIAREGAVKLLNMSIPKGVIIFSLFQDYPAQKAGMLPGDVIFSVNGQPTIRPEELNNVLMGFRPDDVVKVGVFRNNTDIEYTVKLASNVQNSSEPFLGIWMASSPSINMGIRGIGLNETLENYKYVGSRSLLTYLIPPTFTLSQEFVPYSDIMYLFYKSTLGEIYHPIANLAFWIWFVNFNLATFNAFPIYPFDGGVALRALLNVVGKNRLGEKVIRRISIGISFILLLLLATLLLLPYLG